MKIVWLLIIAVFSGLFLAAQECCEEMPYPSARFNAECRSFNVFADLIVWTAREAGADCWAEVFSSSGLTSSNDLREVDFGWDAGFRVGIGYGMEHDQWDTQAYYTWFRTEGSDRVSSLPGSVHSAFLGNFYVDNASGAGLSGPSYQSASIDWAIRFNMFDWELGRNFWVSEALAVRPFLGVKGGWIHQSIHSKWHNSTFPGAPSFSLGRENLKNHFWGIGPVAGIDTKWDLTRSFNLFGDFSGAIMWGHWSFDDLFENSLGKQVAITLPNVNSGATMVRAFMGFGWDANLCENRYQLSTKLGYEMQFWLDQLQLYFFTGGRLNNELTLQGGTLEFCFDF